MSAVEYLEEQIQTLERHSASIQELLALVLDAVGEPVTVTKESVDERKKNGWGNQGIVIDGDPAETDLVLYIGEFSGE